MKVVRPLVVTPTNLISTNVPATDAPAWVAGTYNTGDRVINGTHLYESLADSNTLEPGAETVSPLKWLDLGPINRWLMFDKTAGNKWLIGKFTSNPDTIDVTIRPGIVVNTVGLVGVSATTVQVIMDDPVDGVVYDNTVDMADTGVTNWYDWFFLPIGRRDNVVLTDLPAYGTADVQIIADATGGTAKVGTLVVGSAVTIGTANYGTGIGIESFTRTDIDDFGNVTIVPRGSRRVVDFDIVIETSEISSVVSMLNRIRNTPSLYIGDESIDSTIIVGRFEQLQAVISGPSLSDMNLEVRSLE